MPAFEPWRAVLAVLLLVYVGGLLVLGLRSRRQIRDVADYLVAGRRLSTPLTAVTLLATWFGAGTLLTATDEIRAGGLRRAALDPIGAGLCLVVCGWFFAGPLWRAQLLTLPDWYGRRFGPRAERLAALVMVPGYLGWVAAQLVALAGLLEVLFGLPLPAGLVAASTVATVYTLAGGLWSVARTDAVQMALVVVGVLVLGGATLGALGGGDPVAGVGVLFRETPGEALVVVPTEDATALLGWSNVLAIGVLGNLPGQDLMQRVFAARSEVVAVRACHLAGAAYLVLGLVPMGLGLAAGLLPGLPDGATVPALGEALLSPVWLIPFVVGLVSAVLSTIDGAILSPAGVLAQNLLAPVLRPATPSAALRLQEVAVLLIALASLGAAFAGASAYELLEASYAVGLVGLLVPLAIGLYSPRGGETAAVTSMATGTGVWLVHLVLGWEAFLGPWLAPAPPIPMELAAFAAGAVAYPLGARWAGGVGDAGRS
ncbi:MAG TPA: sodium:solute symporter family protein [Polyangiaceae bacterium LLY-WYZ-14_1]|nr:sodium:solute symporter family protein [Polyangiaceae bacterium LLY-WYZ-14_1]